MQDESDSSYSEAIKVVCRMKIVEDGGWPGTWVVVYVHHRGRSDMRRFQFPQGRDGSDVQRFGFHIQVAVLEFSFCIKSQENKMFTFLKSDCK